MRIENSTKTLYEKLDRCIRSLGSISSVEEIVAVNNYIFNLYDAIESMGGNNRKYDNGLIYSHIKSPRNYRKKIDIYEKGLIEDYIRNQDFHKEFIDKIYSYCEEIVDNIYGDCDSNLTVLSHEDFEIIFYDFLSKYHLEDFFKTFFLDKPIYNNIYSGEDPLKGFSTYNPIIKDCDVFINNFDYTLPSLFSLVHECGHAYDLLNFNDDIKAFNVYFYTTFYNEVISKLFEKLFIYYLIDNGILTDDAKRLLECNIIDNYDFLVSSYIFSLFDDETLLSKKFKTMSDEQIFNVVGKKFSNEDDIKYFLSDFDVYNFYEPFNYTYGDIISMFLTDIVKEDGFSNEVLKEFMDIRGKLFDIHFFDKNDFCADKYIKLLEKQYKLTKK